MNVKTQKILSNLEAKLASRAFRQKIKKLLYKYSRFNGKSVNGTNELSNKEKGMNAIRAKQIDALLQREQKFKERLRSANKYQVSDQKNNFESLKEGVAVEQQISEMEKRLMAHKSLLEANVNIKEYVQKENDERYKEKIDHLKDGLETDALKKDVELLCDYGVDKHLGDIAIDLKLGADENRALTGNKTLNRLGRFLNVSGAKMGAEAGAAVEAPNAKAGIEIGMELNAENLRQERKILARTANQRFIERADRRRIKPKNPKINNVAKSFSQSTETPRSIETDFPESLNGVKNSQELDKNFGDNSPKSERDNGNMLGSFALPMNRSNSSEIKNKATLSNSKVSKGDLKRTKSEKSIKRSPTM